MNNDHERTIVEEALGDMDILYDYAVRMTGNPDIAGACLEKAYDESSRTWANEEEGSDVARGRLFRSMQRCITEHRSEVKDDIRAGFVFVQAEDQGSHLDTGSIAAAFDHAMRTMAGEKAAALILRDVHRLSYETIAEFMQLPVGSVGRLLQCARTTLINELGKYEEEEIVPHGCPEQIR